MSTNQQPTRLRPSRRYLQSRDGEAPDYSRKWTTSYFCADIKDVVLLHPHDASLRNAKKGHWEPTQICEHLDLLIDTATSTFRALSSELHAIATLSRTLLQHFSRGARWIQARQLAVLTGKA
jgi:hypothetical protein